MAKRTRSRVTNAAIVAIILSSLVGLNIYHGVTTTLEYIQFHSTSSTSNITESVEGYFYENVQDYERSNRNYTIDKEMVFVHLGKTAGSSITCMLKPSMHHAGKGDSGCSNKHHQPSAISKVVVERVHLEPAPVEYNAFLITLRNPVHRIISWYYYLHPAYPPVKLARHKRGCENFALFGCWDTLQTLTEQGLNMSTQTHNESATLKECKSIAIETVTGQRKCWHSYFNYNYTYGNLIHAMMSGNDTTANKTIFALRTEHLEMDWATINLLLGSNEEFEILRKNVWSKNESSTFRNETLSHIGRLNLCHALCDEIQIYKKLLHLAINIDKDSESQSLDELLLTCPSESRNIRRCNSQVPN